MEPEKNDSEKNNSRFSASDYLADMDRIIHTLTLRAMGAGNEKDFNTAYSTMELALWLSQSLGKKCLEAVLLNNMGLLQTMEGAWDRAMLSFDRSMQMALVSCPPDDNFLLVLKKNIACLFDPKTAMPGNPAVD